ncbi:uncharacterized protein HaLaN_13834 [Haematococcus lacustris]|uniref:Uncharacterized protein n=1 Tax=Haematococcus lacustris TaxID=44745 RepID=A0A699ZED6_HAELA|nr:uncharacterized protein HaLaN_13834 [Haematococcus lacustris]
MVNHQSVQVHVIDNLESIQTWYHAHLLDQVAGHAVYVGKDYSEASLESSWFLEPYQQLPDLPPAPQLVLCCLKPVPYQHLEVAGHAVYVGKDYSEASLESSWFLEPYQQLPGEAQSFVEHIRLGVLAAAEDPEAMLLFSGGQTRLAAGPRSEGLSYWAATVDAFTADPYGCTGTLLAKRGLATSAA